jgi:uncharacterized SAM-binding protein YcdF (DUF218 family)
LHLIVDNIFTSIGAISAFVLTAGWIAARPQSRAARRTAVGLALVYVVASVYAVPQAVGWALFTRGLRPFAASDVAPGRTAVVLLGGGTDTAHGIGDTTLAVASGDGLERVLEAARVFNMTHAEWLIASGGTLDDRQERDAIVMRDELVQIGIPAARIVLEAESRSTHEQAVLVAPMLKSLGAERVILVTSDVHMPRSLGAFRAYGVQAIPAIAPATGASDPLRRRIVPTVNGLWRSRQVSHELFGIIYYRLRGWWTAETSNRSNGA